MRMNGPYDESDGTKEYRVWTCPKCGFRCEKFLWEYSSEERSDPGIKTLAEYYSRKP